MPTTSQIGRTSSLLASDQLLAAIQRTQRETAGVQDAISSGLSVHRPSEAPGKSAAILNLQQGLEARAQHDRNLRHALSLLNAADGAVADAGQILNEARSIASSQVGVGSDAQTRANQASVIGEQVSALLDLANRSFQSISLFGGNRRPASGKVFEDFLGGVRYVGARTNLSTEIGLDHPLGFNGNGQDVFGALSLRVEGSVDLDPAAAAATRLADLRGALGQGVRLGQVFVTVDGNQVVADLTGAETLGDIETRVNDAIASVDPGAGSLAAGGAGLGLAAAAGHTIAIAEVGVGKTAGDLGIAISAAGAVVAGGDVGPKVTELTPLSGLGPGIDWTGGLKITQGTVTKVADFSGAATVQDLINSVEQLGLGVRMEINADGTGLNLVSEVSGLALSVGENAGGTTATDLGLRTLSGATSLSDFRFGLGIEPVAGQDDFRVQVHDGRTFDVSASGLATVGDLVGAIQSAAAAAGLTVGTPGTAGTDFNLGLAGDGNGLAFEDGTAGGSDFRISQLGTSLVATQLGIHKNAGAAGSIAGDDEAKVRTDSVFTHLIELRDALVNNDSRGITLAGEGVEEDTQRTTRARADLGVRAQRVEEQQDRSGSQKILEESMLSDLRDTDMTEAITRFTQLQQQLQATLSAGARNLQQSFLDFLR